MLPFDEVEELSIITKLAHGMSYLHCKGVMHRDLKAPNVLCQDHGRSIDIKIVDFGVSKFIACAGEAASRPGVGTGYWRAPEIFPTQANRSRVVGVNLMAVDVYSFAMACYEIVTGLNPFELEFGSARSSYDEVVQGKRPELPRTLKVELRDLIIDCWHTLPARRPDFAEICTRLSEIAPHS
jgi:serine/threonine protein kinase